MALTLSDLLTRTRDILGESATGSFWTDAELSRSINDSLDELSQQILIPANTSGSIAANDTTLSLPSDFIELDAIAVDNRILTEITPREMWLKNRTLTDTGQPVVFWWSALRQIFLYPKADTSYTYQLFYFKELPDLSLSSDSPAFDGRWHFILAFGAAWRAWLKMGRRPDLGDGWKTTWEEYKAKCWADLMVKKTRDILTRPIEPLAPRPISANDPLNWP